MCRGNSDEACQEYHFMEKPLMSMYHIVLSITYISNIELPFHHSCQFVHRWKSVRMTPKVNPTTLDENYLFYLASLPRQQASFSSEAKYKAGDA